MEEEIGGSGVVWNFDDAEARLIFEIKLAFINARDSWDLEGAYWALWRYHTEIGSLFEDRTRKELEERWKGLSKLRTENNRFVDLDDEEKGDCMNQLNEFYKTLCDEAVDKGYYFRKRREYVGL